MSRTILPRPNVFEIDLSAIVQNISEVRRVVGTDTLIIAALKGDGYGFGLREVAKVIFSIFFKKLKLVLSKVSFTTSKNNKFLC